MNRSARAALLLWAVAPFAAADEVQLANGDRISGRILNMDGNVLVIATPYVGELRIPRQHVRTLGTDGIVRLLPQGSTVPIPARLAPGAEGGARVIARDGDDAGAIVLSQLAFINPTPDQSGEGRVYHGRVNMAAAESSGNSETSALFGEAELTAKAKFHRYSLGLRAERRSDRGNTTATNWLAKGDYDRFLRPHRFVYGRTSVLKDRFKDVRLQAALGAGYGLQLIDRNDAQLSVRAGLDYVVEDHYQFEDDSYPALGWGVKYSQWVFGRRAEVFHEQEGFFNLTETDDITLRTSSGLRVPLTNALNTTLQLKVDFEGDPSPGRRSTDSTLMLGLGYLW